MHTEDSRPDADIPLEQLPLHSTNLLTVLDETGQIHYESPSIERIYGFDQDDLIGDQVADYFHPDDRDRVLAAFERVVAGDTGDVEAVEYRHLTADGTYCWVESVAAANPTPGGQYVINTRDISAPKAREQTLEQTNERLDAFASIVSHDLRNPLNVAQGALETLQDGHEADTTPPEDIDRSLDDITWAHDRMQTLIADLLTFARDGTYTFTTVALAEVAETCWQGVATDDATLHIETSQTVQADRLRLQQLFENLLRNAIEHATTADGSLVTVTVSDLDDGTGFYVADDGSGIPPADREHVFDAGHSSATGGTGLGLAIVDRIADAHGWDARVTDSEAGGARFEFVVQ